MAKMFVSRVKSYAEEFVPRIDDKGKSQTKYTQICKGVPSHTIQNKLHYNMYEESLFKKKNLKVIIMLF